MRIRVSEGIGESLAAILDQSLNSTQPNAILILCLQTIVANVAETINLRKYQVLPELTMRTVIIGYYRETEAEKKWDQKALDEFVLTRMIELL